MNGTRTPAQRFADKVDRSGGPAACWPYTASVGPSGYGQFRDGQRSYRAHRLAFTLATGQDPQGDVDHTCHNASDCNEGKMCKHRRCCNPAHLEDVSHRENVIRGRAGKTRPPKTVCVNGHDYTDENTYVSPAGLRKCRTCRAAAFERWQIRHASSGSQTEGADHG